MKFVVKLVAVLVLGLFTAPPFAETQQTGKVWRIGYLAVAPNPDLDDAFKQGLRERGYVEGQNLIIAYRFADGVFDRLPGLATELVGLRVDLIVALTTEGVRAAVAVRLCPLPCPVVTSTHADYRLCTPMLLALDLLYRTAVYVTRSYGGVGGEEP